MRRGELPTEVVERRAVVYVRQSTGAQVHAQPEESAAPVRARGSGSNLWLREVVTIDDDLGRSASGLVARPGFEALVAQRTVGAVFCLEPRA